jgi:hypothetical protein
VVIAALDDDRHHEALAWLATLGPPAATTARDVLAAAHLVGGDGHLLAVHAGHGDRIRAHATRGLAAAAALRAMPDAPRASGVERAVTRAIALWNAGLYFEVHEVLEAEWQTSTGAVRHALQGVIQIAVALHHYAHGNGRGARTLLIEGRARLAAQPDALPGIDVPALLADTAPWEVGLRDGTLAGDRPRPILRPKADASSRPAW